MSLTSPLTLTDLERERVVAIQKLALKGAVSLSELIEMLTDSSWGVRRAVVEALSVLGTPAIDALCRLLKNQRDSEARLAAAVDALVAMTVNAEPALVRLSHDPNPAVVADVIQVLGRRRDSSSVPELVKLMAHADDNVAVAAMEALGRIGGRAAVEALIDTIGTGNFFRTFPAIDVLGRSADPRAVGPLVKLLDNPNYLPEAARALGRLGDKSAVAPLLGLLKSPSDGIVRLAALALWDLRCRYEDKSGGDASVIDEMIRSRVTTDITGRFARAMSNADVQEGVALCRILGLVADSEATELLTAALDGPAPVAVCAADALRKIGKNTESHLLRSILEGSSGRRKVLLPLVTRSSAVEEVMTCLSDPDADVRSIACDTLARIGSSASVSKIFQLLSDSNLRVVHSATAAIQALGSRQARTLAAESAKSENPTVRRASLRILGYFGDSESLQTMLDGLVDSDPRVREAALQSLPYLEDPRALEALFTEAKSQNARTRGLAVRSLGQVPKANERIYALLLKRLSDEDSWVRYYACQAIGRLGYDSAAGEVASLFNDEAGQVRVSAVEALSHMNSPEAHQALRRALTFEDLDVRRAALVGLGIAHRIEDLPLILSSATSTDVPTRLIALSSLINFMSPLVLTTLSVAGADTDEQVRSAAIDLLAARPEQDATEILVDLLASQTTRDRARTALMVPSQYRIPGILTALQTANEELAPILISILSKSDRTEAKTALISAMKMDHVPARKAAAPVLAARRDTEMREAVREAAESDPDASVRKICSLLIKD